MSYLDPILDLVGRCALIILWAFVCLLAWRLRFKDAAFLLLLIVAINVSSTASELKKLAKALRSSEVVLNVSAVSTQKPSR